MNRALFYLLLVAAACLLVFRGHGAGRNMQPRVAFTNSIDTSLIVALQEAGASTNGNGNPVTSWNDASVYANHATNVGAARPIYMNNVNATGKGGVFFDGTNHFLLFPTSTSIDITGDFTLMCWAYQTNGSRANVIIGGYQQTGSANGYGLGIGILSTTRPAVWTDTTGNWRQFGNPLPLDSWHHVAVTVTGGFETIYMDAAPGFADTCLSPSSSAVQRRLGCDTAGLFQFPGWLGDVRIYNRALSATEITNIFNADLR